jgi:hypothetical protein
MQNCNAPHGVGCDKIIYAMNLDGSLSSNADVLPYTLITPRAIKTEPRLDNHSGGVNAMPLDT